MADDRVRGGDRPMKVTTDRKALAAAMKAVVVPDGSRIAVISSMHLGVHLAADAKAGVLTLTSTNLELTITVDVPAEVDTEGTAVLPADRFGKFIALCDSERARVDVGEGTASISCGDSDLTLRTMSVDHWPKAEPVDAAGVLLDRADVARIGRITYAVDPEGLKARLTNPARTGVHLRPGRAETTDTFRMAVAALDADLPDVLVPVEVMRRVVDGFERLDVDELVVAADERRVTFATDTMSWTTQLIADAFPDLDAFIGREQPHSLRLVTSELLDALERVAVVDGNTHRHVVLTPDGGKVVVANGTKDIGSAAVLVSCTGDFEATICFDRRFLTALLKAHDEDVITLELQSPRHGMQVRSQDARLLHLLMPVPPGKANAS